jgi:hypothetical protein
MPMRLKTMIGDTWWPAGYYDSLFMADEYTGQQLYFFILLSYPGMS